MARPIRDMAETAQQIAAGDLNHSLAYESGDELGTLADSIRGVSSTLTGVSDDPQQLVTAASEGQLDVRGDASRYSGTYQTLLSSMNDCVDAFAVPVMSVVAVMERMANGDLTARIDGAFSGEFKTLQDAT